MSLTASFELTPRNSYFNNSGSERARLYMLGPAFYPRYHSGYRYSFDKQHENDETYFRYSTAADPNIDYTNWLDRGRAPHVILFYDLSTFGNYKELALVFGFDAISQSRILVYSNSDQLADILLEPGDNQFLMEVESVDPMSLYFIHARRAGSEYGGNWFFRGITGYVV